MCGNDGFLDNKLSFLPVVVGWGVLSEKKVESPGGGCLFEGISAYASGCPSMRCDSVQHVADKLFHVQSLPLQEIPRLDTTHSLIRDKASIPTLGLPLPLSLFWNHSFNKSAVLFLPFSLANISEVTPCLSTLSVWAPCKKSANNVEMAVRCREVEWSRAERTTIGAEMPPCLSE
jgi:hypothetical protein